MTPLPILNEILEISLAAAPWLLLGLLAAGLIRALVPNAELQRWVGGEGPAAVARAAVIGAPLPLCSCGAIPTALALHRGGAGRGPTTAFLVGTPGIGADSVALTYALLGPVMMLARVAGAVTTAIATGLLVAGSQATRAPAAAAAPHKDTCCGTGCEADGEEREPGTAEPFGARLRAGMRFAFIDLLDDISLWIALGLIIAGAISWAAGPEMLAAHGSGLPAMLVMSVIGIPVYICAAAATPIAAAMIAAGVSPGTALVFLLAGPITSMATLAILRREMGNGALARYLLGIIATTVVAGLLADRVIGWAGIDVHGQIGAARELVPAWFAWSALILLATLAVPPLRGMVTRLGPTAAAGR